MEIRKWFWFVFKSLEFIPSFYHSHGYLIPMLHFWAA